MDDAATKWSGLGPVLEDLHRFQNYHLRLGLKNDAIAIWNTFGIELISTKDEQHFMDEPNPDGLLVDQMQCIDLQKIDGRRKMPNLA